MKNCSSSVFREMNMTKLLTVSQVADILAISKSLVYELVDRGDLPFVKVGTSKGYRFDPEDIKTFIRKRKRQNRGQTTPSIRPRLKHLRN